MKKDVWGPIIWTFLHTLTLRIKPEFFENEKKDLIRIVLNVCSNLPCPTCALHATSYLTNKKISNITQKEHLVLLLFNLHNDANQRTKKETISLEMFYSIYEKIDLYKACNNYIKLMKTSHYSEKMMLYSFQKREFLNKLFNYLKDNLFSKYDIIDENYMKQLG